MELVLLIHTIEEIEVRRAALHVAGLVLGSVSCPAQALAGLASAFPAAVEDDSVEELPPLR